MGLWFECLTKEMLYRTYVDGLNCVTVGYTLYIGSLAGGERLVYIYRFGSSRLICGDGGGDILN